MKKIMNRPEDFVSECIEGILLAYGGRLRAADPERRVLVRASPPVPGKVGIVTGGGSGHLPMFLGYVGEGLLDACAVGNVFASPSAQKMLEAIQAADSGSGVLCLYGNYGGDAMNFDMACEMAALAGIEARQVRVKDDVASRPPAEKEHRRGVAGMAYAFKIAGAAAAEMLPLERVAGLAQEALDNIRSMGVALSPCVIPEAGKATFQVGPDEMELGMGIHGEPGIRVCKMMPAEELAHTLLERLLQELPLRAGSEVSVMVNGLGATPLEELLLLYRSVHQRLTQRGVAVYMPHIGQYATSMEMAGCSLTLFKLDGRFKELLRKPASTPFYTNANL